MGQSQVGNKLLSKYVLSHKHSNNPTKNHYAILYHDREDEGQPVLSEEHSYNDDHLRVEFPYSDNDYIISNSETMGAIILAKILTFLRDNSINIYDSNIKVKLEPNSQPYIVAMFFVHDESYVDRIREQISVFFYDLEDIVRQSIPNSIFEFIVSSYVEV